MTSTPLARPASARRILVLGGGAAAAFAILASALPAGAGDCPEEPLLQNWAGGGNVTCPCFAVGEEAGSVLDAPANHYPIEILRVGIGWGSQGGGQPDSLEQAIHIYGAGLPNPGAPIATFLAPVLSDGFINEYNLESEPGEIIVNNGPFTVTLEFANANANMASSPSVVHDGPASCQAGKNVVYAIPPGAWFNACVLGVTGDWVFHVVYRRVDCDEDSTYCLTSANSVGTGALIGFAGSTSIGSDDLVLTTQELPSNKPGLFYYGPTEIQVPFGDGVRCVGGGMTGTFRLNPPVNSDLFGNVARVLDYNAPPANGGNGAITAGSTWKFQLWYRDPAAAMAGFNLSDGLSLTFEP